jgi:hypothetical protein
MKEMKVSNVEEAVALARKLKQAGEYDWFRGQVRDWDPVSTLERKVGNDPVKLEDYQARLGRFFQWVSEQEGLSHLAEPENMDSIFAIMQHYGFPTNYIDFSTDPSIAGFFASDCDSPPGGDGVSVIYCLNTVDLKDFYKKITGTLTDLKIEFIDVDVSNLWRLHAQHGKFLFANHNWYHFYDMDRIVFPWSGYPADPPKDLIYPSHKSPLEIRLDQYFHLERLRSANKQVLEMSKSGAGFSLFQVEDSGPDFYSAEVFSRALVELPDWGAASLSVWHEQPSEAFQTTVGGVRNLTIRDGVGSPKPSDQIYYALLGMLDREKDLRTKAIDWCVIGEVEGSEKGKLPEYMRAAWNGMRNLPYSTEDIASAFAALMDLCIIPGRKSFMAGVILDAFKEWVPDAVEVDFGALDGAGSRGYCSEAWLINAINESWHDAWQSKHETASATSVFQACYNPRLMFNFNDFKSLFARQIIPSQIARERDLVLFNPAQVRTFGLP